jgi:methyl-accepting chemotaxis protein
MRPHSFTPSVRTIKGDIMFARLKLTTKIAVGFAALIAVTLTLGIWSSLSMLDVSAQSEVLANEYVPEVEVSGQIERNILQTMMDMRAYGLVGDQAYWDCGQTHIKELKKYLVTAQELADNSTHLEQLSPALARINKQWNLYQKQIAETAALTKDLAENRKTLDEAAANYMAGCRDLLESQNRQLTAELGNEQTSHEALAERTRKINLVADIIDVGHETRVACFKGQALRDLALLHGADEHFEQMDRILLDLRKITRKPVDIAELDKIHAAAKNYSQAMDALQANWTRRTKLAKERFDTSSEMFTQATQTALAGMDHAETIANSAQADLSTSTIIVMVGQVVAVVISVFVAIVLTRSIARPLRNIFRGLKSFSTEELQQTGEMFRRIVSGLDLASRQTTDSATQIATTSQQMAEGSSEQAASIEETSASMEEISSVVKNNAEHARRASQMASQNTDSTRQAKSLTDEALNFAREGNTSVEHMSEAIGEIRNSAEETAKIIKTIDEIAFQTNLLALNAAVEAARAGDAGKGFAVVAEEVRNLAQRSAQAAKSTAELINDSARNSESGVKVVKEVNEVFGRIVQTVEKVSTNVAEITAASTEQTALIDDVSTASEEQARGIDQVNVGVSQIDTVTQRNAANAEELAASAEELNSQAVDLDRMIRQLQELVDGASSASEDDLAYQPDAPQSPTVAPAHRPTASPRPEPRSEAPAEKTPPATAGATISSAQAEKAIPFEDENSSLSEF